jgi:SAM-dependent methyltransferase
MRRRHSIVDGQWRQHFEQRAQWTHGEAQASAWSAAGLAARLGAFEQLLPELAPGPRLRVLDLGCGAGTYAGLLARRGHGVTALDYATAMVRRARSAHGGVRFVVADGQSAPLRSASFDLVLCIGVLQCCAESATLIREITRLVRPGGGVLLEGLNPLHVAVPGLTLRRLLRRGAGPSLVRHAPRLVERQLAASGIEVRGHLRIHVDPPPGMWPARLVLRLCHRLPGLSRFGTSAIWWHGRRRAVA